MEPRARYYSNLLAGIVMLIVPVADHIKRIPASFAINGFEIAPILMAAVFFGMAIKAKREIARLR
jgi:hypothetical protein